MLELHLRIAGFIAIVLAATYPIYPRYFQWKKELQAVSLFTRQLFWVHCGFIVKILALQGVLLLFFPQCLLENSNAAIALLAGLSAFWLFRLFAQLAIYDRKLWVGNRLHTFVHVVFTLIWIYMSFLFTAVLADKAFF